MKSVTIAKNDYEDIYAKCIEYVDSKDKTHGPQELATNARYTD